MKDSCLTELRATLEDPKDFQKDIDDAWELAKESTLDEGEANKLFLTIMSELRDQEGVNAAQQKVQVVKALQTRREATALFNGFISEGKGSVLALAETTATLMDKANMVASRALQYFDQELSHRGLDVYLRNQDNSLKILQEIGEINTTGGKPGISGSPEAKEIAEIFQNIINKPRAQLAENGIPITNLEGRMLKQSFTPEVLARMGKESFVNQYLKRINRKQVFERDDVGDKEVIKFLEGVYGTVIGDTKKEVSATARDMSFEGRTTLAHKLGRHRKVHLNSAEDSLYTIEHIAKGTVAGTMANAIRSTYKQAASVDFMGPNFRNTIEYLKEQAKKISNEDDKFRIENPSGWEDIRGLNVDNMADIFDGRINEGGSMRLKQFVGITNKLIRASLLQKVGITSIGDIPAGNRAVARIGGEVSKAVGLRIDLALRGLTHEERLKLAGPLNASNAYAMANLYAMHSNDGMWSTVGNFSTKYANAVSKYSGQDMITNNNKGSSSILYLGLAQQELGTHFAELDKGLRLSLLRGGVTDKDWNFLSGLKDSLEGKIMEHSIFDTGRILELSDEVVQKGYFGSVKATRSELKATKRRLYDAMEGATSRFADDAMVVPGARERSVMNMRQGDGTIMGAMRSSMFNLMGYPITYMFRQIGREAELTGKVGSGMLKLLTGAILYGYIADALYDLSTGKVKDYASDDPKIQLNNFVSAFGRGGGGGIVGSWISELVSRGETPMADAGGVTLQVIDKTIMGLVTSGAYLAQGEVDKAAASSLKTLKPWVPFAQLPYTAIMSNNLYYELLGAVDPDAVNNVESAWKKRTGGRYFDIAKPN